jgi:hypothetical protein
MGAEEENLWLKQGAFEKNQSLPFELVYEFAKRDTEIMILLSLLVL